MFLVPLPESGLKYVIDVHADAPDGALVDLDLMQMGGPVGDLPRRSPVVLPVLSAQPVLDGPLDGLGVGVDAGALMAQHRLPTA